MKRVSLVAIIVLSLAAGFLSGDALAAGKFDKSNCTFNGKKLYGRVQVVDAFPDIKVQVVTTSPDLKVQKIDRDPLECGQWWMVTTAPVLKVQFVTVAPDLKIQYVTAFPGIPK
jgi:hypothetical protein